MLQQLFGFGAGSCGGASGIDIMPIAAAVVEVIDEVSGRIAKRQVGPIEAEAMVSGGARNAVSRANNLHLCGLK